MKKNRPDQLYEQVKFYGDSKRISERITSLIQNQFTRDSEEISKKVKTQNERGDKTQIDPYFILLKF
jgi:hypothetical protein